MIALVALLLLASSSLAASVEPFHYNKIVAVADAYKKAHRKEHLPVFGRAKAPQADVTWCVSSQQHHTNENF